MNIVITMGGLGSRFKKAGYTIPKYEIEVKGKSLFEWSLLSLKSFWNERFIFIVREEDNAKDFIKRNCDKMKLKYHIIEINYLTSGQAETALLAESEWSEDDALLIYNIDTYVEPGCMNKEAIQGDGWIPCFHAEGDHWSFVKIDKEEKAVEVREKKRISDNCSLGAYYFKSAKIFKELYLDFYKDKNNIENNERYIAPMYNYMIKKGYNVYIQNINAANVHVLGTPEEVSAFNKNHIALS